MREISVRKKSNFLKDIIILSTGSISSQIIPAASLPVIARLFSPETIGLFGIYMACTMPLVAISTLQYESAILVTKTKSQSSSLTAISIVISLAIFLLIEALLLLVMKQPQLQLNESLKYALFCAPLNALFYSISNVLVAVLINYKSYKIISICRLTQALAVAGSTIILGSMYPNLFSLIIGLLIGQMLASVILIYIVISQRYALPVKRERLICVARKYINFPKYSAAAALLENITAQVPIYVIGFAFGAITAGFYNMANRITALPVQAIGGSIGNIFIREFSSANIENINQRKILTGAWTKAAIIGLPIFSIILFFGPHLFGIILGEKWFHSGKIASMLAPIMYMMFISSPTSSAYNSMGLQKLSLRFGIWTCIYRPASFMLGFHFDSLQISIWTYSILEFTNIIVYNLILWRKCK